MFIHCQVLIEQNSSKHKGYQLIFLVQTKQEYAYCLELVTNSEEEKNMTER